MLQRFLKFSSVVTALLLLNVMPCKLWAQLAESTVKENGLLMHGMEQYEQGHYDLAAATLKEYLSQPASVIYRQAGGVVNATHEKAYYYYLLSSIKNKDTNEIARASRQLAALINPNYRSHLALNLGEYYFRKGDLKAAIAYYEQADIAYLTNEEIADKKFELAYSYFNNRQFDKAKPLFAAIKDLPDNKYYIPGNYYYGLLAYNDKNYEGALKSFRRIDKEPTYQDVVPYYEAEIYYFSGKPYRVLEIAKEYLKKDSLYYTQDMELLTAQTLFEQEKYADALPYFESYYERSDKIRKEELYELAYSYYRLKDWHKAISRFQPLSNAKDSLGQTAMYLLGDCYLKVNDKKGARHAFEICSNLSFNPSQTEAAGFLYAKLSDELGYESIATKKLHSFITTYPNSAFVPEAKTLLSQLLARSSNYAEAFKLMSDLPTKDESAWQLFQKVAVGRAFQLLQNNQLSAADSILNLSLQQPMSGAYEAVAYFWKGEIAYRLEHYQQAIDYSRSFLTKALGEEAAVASISKQASAQNAQMIIGYAQMKAGDYSNAQQAFAQARATRESNPREDAAATLYEADALFMQKDFSGAKSLYQDAIAKGIDRSDYARYQLALINGLTGDTAAKRQILHELVDKQPASPYQAKARYELALIQLGNGATTKAIDGFKILINDEATPEQVRSQSLAKLAYAYRLEGNDDQALSLYETFLKDYPADTGRGIALEAIRNIYISKGTPEQYVAFLKENNLPNPDEATLEATFYDAAIQAFNKDAWTEASDRFTDYLQKFPKGENAVKAHFYRGVSYDKQNSVLLALQDFDSVLSNGWSDFSADAATAAARLYYTRKNYEQALKYYAVLRNVTTDKQMLQTAYEGLMKSSFNLMKYEPSIAFADTLLTLPQLPKDMSAQAQLFKARSLQQLNYPEKADSLYQTLDKENLGAVSAEARYRLAEISFDKGDLEEAEKRAGYAAQASSGQDYWVVKCYILLGDILTEEKDYFNAKATLSSIVKNTNIASLKKEASEKLERVKAIEEAHSKLKEN